MRFLTFMITLVISVCSYAEQTSSDESPLQVRFEYEEQAKHAAFGIIPHKANYLLPFSYNDKIQQYDSHAQDKGTQQLEIEFQISFKMPIMVDIAQSDISLFFAYSQVSFWQAYNVDNSSPFRETNYEPELFAQWDGNIPLTTNWAFKAASIGLTHQSNGQSDPISRSWNRLEARFIAETHNLVIALTPWYRFKEEIDEDNNPDLLDYYGHGKLTLAYKLNQQTFSLTTRNNLESGFSKGSLQGTWSFPIHGKIKGYFKVFSGYGNSLIEYDQYTNTLGLGISMTDLL